MFSHTLFQECWTHVTIVWIFTFPTVEEIKSLSFTTVPLLYFSFEFLIHITSTIVKIEKCESIDRKKFFQKYQFSNCFYQGVIKKFSFIELLTEVKKFARVLRDLNVKKGDRVYFSHSFSTPLNSFTHNFDFGEKS